MSNRWLAATARIVAIVIAIAALIDPVFTVQRPSPSPLVLVNLLDSGIESVAQELREIDRGVVIRTPVNHRVPCAPGDRCVIAADGSGEAELPEDIGSPPTLIAVKRDGSRNVAIQSAGANAYQSAWTAGAIRVVLDGRGVSGRRITVRVTDAGAVVGSAEIEWTADASQTVDVPWWPIATGARVLRVQAVKTGDEAVDFDNVVDLPVEVENRRLPVLIFDARSSWSSTFVRRALEDDPRFIVDHRARVAPALSTGTANGRLDAAVLERSPLLIVGAPDALTAAEVDLADRFVRVRGGSVMLLPEGAPAGAAQRLFPGEWSEQLLAEPENVGELRASELLRPGQRAFGAVAMSAAVLATPVGEGHVVVSGAMDAWRYRDASTGFDRFWTSLAAETAALGEQVRIEFDDLLAAPGSRVDFTVRYRALTIPATIEASAVSRCGVASQAAASSSPGPGAANHLRLWPAGPTGVFRGQLPIADGASCSVEVAINDAVASRSVAIAASPAVAAASTLAKLERAVQVSGGVVTDGDNVARLRDLVAPASKSAATQIHPMRAGWWVLPFVGCLSLEWWLRRRKGLH